MVHPHPVNSVSFVNAQVGYGVGVPGDAGALLKSDNGGHAWSEIGHAPTAAIGFVTAQLVFLTEQHGFLVYNSPSPNKSWIYETNDGGTSWTLLKNLNGANMLLIFAGAQDGVAFSQTQHWVTTNGGKSWFQVQLKSPWLPWLWKRLTNLAPPRLTELAPPSAPRFVGLKHENCFKKSEKDVESGALSEYQECC